MTKSKFFRVATEGATTDGRVIQRSWIEQIAKNFNTATYSPRVWLEHMRGMLPDSPFKAYGDVVAVKAEAGADGKLALFAQITPLPELVAMNKAKQKLFTSIEVQPNFGGSGEAYLTGLAVTDSPASLGTEMLAFSATQGEKSPLAARKSTPDALFTEAVAFTLEMEDPQAEDPMLKFKAAFNAIAEKFKLKSGTDALMFEKVLEGFEKFGDEVQLAMKAQADKFTADLQALRTEHKATADAFAALQAKLQQTPGNGFTQRPAASGGNGQTQTDC